MNSSATARARISRTRVPTTFGCCWSFALAVNTGARNLRVSLAKCPKQDDLELDHAEVDEREGYDNQHRACDQDGQYWTVQETSACLDCSLYGNRPYRGAACAGAIAGVTMAAAAANRSQAPSSKLLENT